MCVKSKHEISQIIPISQHVLRVSYRIVNDFIRENETSNIIVSLFITSIARLKLLSYLQMIERVQGTTICYVNTDSVILNVIILTKNKISGNIQTPKGY